MFGADLRPLRGRGQTSGRKSRLNKANPILVVPADPCPQGGSHRKDGEGVVSSAPVPLLPSAAPVPYWAVLHGTDPTR